MNGTEQLLEQVRLRAAACRGTRTTPLPPPLAAAGPARAEAILGFTLPPLLTELHTRVADGGFGPGSGLLPLADGPASAVARYGEKRRSGWRWPEGVLPVLDWGCGLLACVDCRSESAQVLLFEPNLGDPDLAWFVDAPGLADWLTGWLDGTAWFSEPDGAEETAEGPGEEADDLDLAPWAEFRSRV